MEELLLRIALATKRTAQPLEQQQPGDTVDVAHSPAEPPAVEPLNQKITDAYPLRWGTLNGLREVTLTEYVRWPLVDRAIKL